MLPDIMLDKGCAMQLGQSAGHRPVPYPASLQDRVCLAPFLHTGHSQVPRSQAPIAKARHEVVFHVLLAQGFTMCCENDDGASYYLRMALL